MRHLTLATTAIAIVVAAAALATAPASAYNGPQRDGNMCWKSSSHHGGNAVGHWEPCAPATTATTRSSRAR